MGCGWFSRGAVLAVAVVALLVAPTALAATPEQIYRDYADDSRLDGSYTDADLQAALQNPVVQGYGGEEVVTGLRPAIQSQIAAQQQQPAGSVLGTARQSEGLPFTGLDLALLTAGGLFLLAFGVSMRRLAKAKR
jgi:hypothetical protein